MTYISLFLFAFNAYASYPQCSDPMRITKKFAGASCIGKQVFQPCSDAHDSDVVKCEEELSLLEDSFLARLLGREAKVIGGGRTSSNNNSSNNNSGTNSSGKKVSTTLRSGNIGDGYIVEDEEDGVKPILIDTSDWLLSNKVSPQGRAKGGLQKVMSAPALSSLQNSRMFKPVNVPKQLRKHDAFSSSRCSPTRITGVYTVQPRRNSMKRILSSMDLEEYESYSSNDRAAGDLLLQFVLKVKGGDTGSFIRGGDQYL